MGSVSVSGSESFDVRNLIVPGAGGRRVFRILLTDMCQHACDDCPMRSQMSLPKAHRSVSGLARIFMKAYRMGWCDGLFVMSGIPKSPVVAMERTLEIVELLRETLGYRGYLHVKAVEGATPAQTERLAHVADRISFHLEPACERVQIGTRETGFLMPAPAARPEPAARASLQAAASARSRPAATKERRAMVPASPARDTASGRPAALLFDVDPKIRWAMDHPEAFPVDLATAGREDLRRVPGLGEATVERVIRARALGCGPRGLSDLARMGALTARAAGYLTLRGRRLHAPETQAPLFTESILGVSALESRSDPVSGVLAAAGSQRRVGAVAEASR